MPKLQRNAFAHYANTIDRINQSLHLGFKDISTC